MHDIDVSVLIPIHAARPEQLVWLEEAVESVRAQDYPRKRIVILDDGSPYAVEAKRFPDCTILHQPERQGVCEARNALGNRCETEWLLWLDADDKLYEGALGKLVEHAQPNRIVYGDLVAFGDGHAERYYAISPYDCSTLLERPIVPVTTLHTKAAFEKVEGFDPFFEDGLEDWDYAIRLMLAGFCGENIGERVIWYRRHPAQRSKGSHWLRGMTQKVHDKYRGLGGVEMPCCGGGGARRGVARGGNPGPAKTANPGPPSGEMILVRYMGLRQGGFTLRGKGTGQRYRFSAQAHDRDRWVWPADARELLRLPDFRAVPKQAQVPEPDVVLLEKESQAPPSLPPMGISSGRPTPADDLTTIRGLGGARQKALNDIGIQRFEELAVADLEVVAETAKVSLEKAAEWIHTAREKL